MQLIEAFKYLKEKGLESDNDFMLGLMYEDDLFSLVKLTWEDCGDDGEVCVAHLTSGYLTRRDGDQVFYSGETPDDLLFDVFGDGSDDDNFKKVKDINYKVYQLDQDVIELITEHALYALFPDLPNALISSEVVPSQKDIAEFKKKAKEYIDLVNTKK